MANRNGKGSPEEQGGKFTGFSVIELLIVVAIVAVIAAIAIPNLLRSKVAANEASAIGSLRGIMSAEAAYKAMYGIGYSNDLASLAGTADSSSNDGQASCNAAQLLDAGLAKNVTGDKTRKSGYQFTFTSGKEPFKPEQPVPSGCTIGKADGYVVQADPVDSEAGKRHFCADASGVIRVDANREIDVTAPVCAPSAPELQ